MTLSRIGQERLSAHLVVPIYSWSDRARSDLARLAEVAKEGLRETWVEAASPYGLTATVAPDARDVIPASRISSYAANLQMIALSHPLALLREMVEGDITFEAVRLFCALIRDDIVDRCGDPRRALVPPIEKTESPDSEFPLHSDLFGADLLMNIFHSAPLDGSGEVLLMEAPRALFLLRAAGAPTRVTRRVQQLLRRDVGGPDGFDELLELLYSPEHAWSQGFRALVSNESIRMAPARGSGYILNDSQVLHGRTRSSEVVQEDRLVRLVFSSGRTRATQPVRIESSRASVRWSKARKARVLAPA